MCAYACICVYDCVYDCVYVGVCEKDRLRERGEREKGCVRLRERQERESETSN